VVAALERHGYTVRTVTSGDTFARLLVSGPDGMHETEPDKVEMAADWRAHPPVQLAIGPVLHLDDAIANKMCALYGRALPRDFLDIDAALASGRYTRERLLKLAADADDGFDPRMLADALGALTQITEAAFADTTDRLKRSPQCGAVT
jgi:Nucleotidyl transferase AbiEii toxin, Type IV TA system